MIAWTALVVAGEMSLLERLDPLTRAKVLAALIVLLLVLFTVVGLVWLAFRFFRRYMTAHDRERPYADSWLAEPEPSATFHDDEDEPGADAATPPAEG